MKIKRVYISQRNSFLHSVCSFLQTHPRVRKFLFCHFRHIYTKLRYFSNFEKWITYHKANDIHEKLFWLSVNWRNPLIVQCADKFAVRNYVEEKGCGDILNDLYGVYKSSDEILFEDLPKRFVIKSNRGSGDNFFCKDKSLLDKGKLKQVLDSWEKKYYGIDTAEYQYYKIPFRLICEKFLLDTDNEELIEYQLFCFNGEPESFLVRNDLESSGKNPFGVSYSLDWKRVYYRKGEEFFNVKLPKPANYQKMIEYSRRLAKPFPHVRVDFYEVDEKLVFGEMTFSTHGNVLSNYKAEVLEKWGNLLTLPPKYKEKDRY